MRSQVRILTERHLMKTEILRVAKTYYKDSKYEASGRPFEMKFRGPDRMTSLGILKVSLSARSAEGFARSLLPLPGGPKEI